VYQKTLKNELAKKVEKKVVGTVATENGMW
jgi:hypothetical protein